MTVRALYHYDDIGLLSASERTAAGHRRYTAADLRRLYRVLALRGLGLSLEQIRTALDEEQDDLAGLREVLARQRRELEERAGQIDRLRHHIGDLLRQIDSATVPDADQFMRALEMISMFDSYFTRQQREFLVARSDELGEHAVDALKSQWLELVEQLRRHQQDGTPPGDPAVQALAVRWDALAARFHDDDEQIKAAAARMWQHNNVEICDRMGWSADQTDELVTYLACARDAGGELSSGHR
jgi:DNA-binding transcriptional MerR regulator